MYFFRRGSTDRTIEIINNFEQKNISKIVLNDQIGLSKALNSGFKSQRKIFNLFK